MSVERWVKYSLFITGKKWTWRVFSVKFCPSPFWVWWIFCEIRNWRINLFLHNFLLFILATTLSFHCKTWLCDKFVWIIPQNKKSTPALRNTLFEILVLILTSVSKFSTKKIALSARQKFLSASCPGRVPTIVQSIFYYLSPFVFFVTRYLPT